MAKEKGFFAKAFDNMKENTKKQHEIDKDNFNAIKNDNKERYENAKKINPDFQEFKEAKGLKNKAKVVLSHIERNGKEITAKNQEDYKNLLEKQRDNMKNTINK